MPSPISGEMTARNQLQVYVNAELILNAGTCEEIVGPHGRELLIRPPETTLFHQVLAYLRAKANPPNPCSGSMAGREGAAASATILRCGSYLAVLLDRNKPVWPEVQSASLSRISDEEMARINIEASAALAEWIDIYRADPGGPQYTQLVDRAVYYLPLPKKTSKLRVTEFAALADPDIAARVVQAADTKRLECLRADVERCPSRVFANALVNTAWRNGPIEDIHAGGFRGYPIDQRRVTPAEERELLDFVSERLALGMTICQQLANEQQCRAWSEQVQPYGLVELLLITPSRWTLTESSREVHLPL